LRKNVASGAWFACVSEATRNDLLSVFPQAESRAVTIHNMVSHDYFAEDSRTDRIPEIIRTRLNTRIKPPLTPCLRHKLFDDAKQDEPLEYLLIVSTIEPRKNHLSLLTAWELLRLAGFPKLKLVVVGSQGWHHKKIVKTFRVWMERAEVFLLEDVPAAELRSLYRHARATICPSFGEGFDFSGVEAMKSGGAVVASDIAVHREVFADAAEYFNPYSVQELSRVISDLIDPSNSSRRDELVGIGAIVARRYDHDVILPRWRTLFNSAKVAA
jgi:hypothetical protein